MRHTYFSISEKAFYSEGCGSTSKPRISFFLYSHWETFAKKCMLDVTSLGSVPLLNPSGDIEKLHVLRYFKVEKLIQNKTNTKQLGNARMDLMERLLSLPKLLLNVPRCV